MAHTWSYDSFIDMLVRKNVENERSFAENFSERSVQHAINMCSYSPSIRYYTHSTPTQSNNSCANLLFTVSRAILPTKYPITHNNFSIRRVLHKHGGN